MAVFLFRRMDNIMKLAETERLYLREFNIEDAENFFNLNLDPDVIKYTADNSFENIEDARVFIEQYDHYKKHGFGRWAVIRIFDNEFLGWCGLKYTESLDEYDIGFRFFKKYWNHGYATEAAKACIVLGFEKYSMREIVGRAMTENFGSIRVLEKIGLKYFGPYDFGGEKGVIYIIEN
jgi:RimJ/RimL family protein N-acetyltransferase